ncbi:APC family permease [Salinisphaera sp. USBA-960]|uniref:APC family permease n=1 Tax=Salinisphaera orenii TaxID=856731 RepID=UPI000DBE604D|nr:APC family permease [Salifodinibacter halophilus]NNC25617.1 APC family permease [Salifodinibacter halophilus]
MGSDVGAGYGKLKRGGGAIGLTLASTTSMIGSGWLFGAFHVARLAGPWSILSWVIGACIILLIALCFAELATMFPRSGALVHMSHASHGVGLGRVWGWLLFLAYVPIPAVEAEAIVTYANNYLPIFLQPDSGGLLNATGFAVAVVLLGIFALLNLLAVRWLLNLNSVVTIWKVFVPLAAVVALLASTLHPSNLTAAPESYSLTGILTALPTAGVVFSFLGFRTAIDLAGETHKPERYMPIAVIGSIGLAALVYIALQVAFLLVLSPSDIAGGWSSLDFAGSTGPFAGLAVGLGMTWLAAIIYVDAYVSPAGTGWLMMTGGTRVLMANGERRAGPAWLARINRFGVPWTTVIVMWAVGCLFFLPFPAWQQMVGYISAVTVLTYGLGPLVLICLRRQAPNAARPFKVRASNVVAPLAFIASNWIILWTGYTTNLFLFSLIGGGFVVYAIYYHMVARLPADQFGWGQIWWLLPWFGGMLGLSKLSAFGGGMGVLPFVWGLVAVAVWSLIIIAAAFASALPPQQSQRVIADVLAGSLSESSSDKQ